MRNRRGVTIGTILGAAMVVVVAGTALNSQAEEGPSVAAPVAPFSYMSLDGGSGSAALWGTKVYETITGFATNKDFLQITANSADNFGVVLGPPTGSTWTTGATYPVKRAAATATTGSIAFVTPDVCPSPDGAIAVHEVAHTGAYVTSFAATFTVSCDGGPAVLTGDIGWNSSVDYVAALGSTADLSFFNGDTSPQTVTFTGKGSLPVAFGAASVTGDTPEAFSITADTCSHASISYGQTCVITVTPHPAPSGSHNATLVIADNTPAGSKYIGMFVAAGPQPTTPPPTTAPPTSPPPTEEPNSPSNVGSYFRLIPSRILDTRLGNGSARAPIGQDSTLLLQVAGRGGVPASGVSAVVLNVTVTGAIADSYLTVYPHGAARPTASSLNFGHGWTGANSTTVGLGSGGLIDLYNHVGSTDVIVDVVGFYAADSPVAAGWGRGAGYLPVLPDREFDSRQDLHAKVPAGFSVRIPFSFGLGPDQHIRAVVANITAVDADGPGYLSTWDGVGPPPNTSTVNYAHGEAVPNLAVVPVALCEECDSHPAFSVYTHANANVVVDILGVFVDTVVTGALRFTPRTPERIVDTRTGHGPLGQFTTATFTAPDHVAAASTQVLALNVTAVTPTASTFVTVWPAGIPGMGMPASSNLNPAAGQTVPNALYGELGPTKAFNVYNNVGSVDLVVDVVGSFAPAPDATGARAQFVAPPAPLLTLLPVQPGPLLQRTG